jgi:hypothetical protein
MINVAILIMKNIISESIFKKIEEIMILRNIKVLMGLRPRHGTLL